MLGGTAPVLLFNLASVSTSSFGIPENSIFNISLPLLSVPVYLDEKLTGILVDDHERTLSVSYEQDSAQTYERVISSEVTVTLIARKDNVMLNAILALFELVLKYVPSQSYKLIFYYDDVLMTDASLVSMHSMTRPNTDVRELTFTLNNRPIPQGKSEQLKNVVTDSLDIFPEG